MTNDRKKITEERTLNVQVASPPPMAEGLQEYMQVRHRERELPMPTSVQFDPMDMSISIPAGLIFLNDAWHKSVVSIIATQKDLAGLTKMPKKEEVVDRLSEHMGDDGDMYFRVNAFADLQLYLKEHHGNMRGFADEVVYQLKILARDLCEYAWDYVHANMDDVKVDADGNLLIKTNYDPDNTHMEITPIRRIEVDEDEDDFGNDFVGEWA